MVYTFVYIQKLYSILFQVVLCMNLKEKESGKELCVATTHLKARKGALLSTLRNTTQQLCFYDQQYLSGES